MVAPVKAAGLGSHGFDADDWDPRKVFAKLVQEFRSNQLLNLQTQSCLTYPCWAEHENERTRFGSPYRIHQGFFGFQKPWVRHGVNTKAFETLFTIRFSRQPIFHQKSL